MWTYIRCGMARREDESCHKMVEEERGEIAEEIDPPRDHLVILQLLRGKLGGYNWKYTVNPRVEGRADVHTPEELEQLLERHLHVLLLGCAGRHAPEQAEVLACNEMHGRAPAPCVHSTDCSMQVFSEQLRVEGNHHRAIEAIVDIHNTRLEEQKIGKSEIFFIYLLLGSLLAPNVHLSVKENIMCLRQHSSVPYYCSINVHLNNRQIYITYTLEKKSYKSLRSETIPSKVSSTTT